MHALQTWGWVDVSVVDGFFCDLCSLPGNNGVLCCVCVLLCCVCECVSAVYICVCTYVHVCVFAYVYVCPCFMRLHALK